MRKKILFTAYSIHGGGAEKCLQAILKGLDRERFEPHLCLFSLTGKEKEVIPSDVELYTLQTPLRPATVFLVWKLLKLLRRVRPDKVFSMLWGVNIVSITASWLAGIPVVVNEATITSESVKRYSFPFLRKRLIAALYKKTEAIIAIADSVKKDLTANFGLPQTKIIMVHNGVPIADIEASCSQYSVGTRDYVFSCGGLNRWKNHELLIKAMGPLKGTPLIILGKGPLKNYLADMARTAGVDLSLPGYAENPYPYFKNASVFVLTSLYEGLGNVLLEAMVCRVPVIAVDCPGGVREIITDGRTGLIVPQNDAQALGGAIKTILGDRAKAGELAEAAYRNVKENFSFNKMLESYERVIGPGTQ